MMAAILRMSKADWLQVSISDYLGRTRSLESLDVCMRNHLRIDSHLWGHFRGIRRLDRRKTELSEPTECGSLTQIPLLA
jgi:hypothetical protein